MLWSHNGKILERKKAAKILEPVLEETVADPVPAEILPEEPAETPPEKKSSRKKKASS